jgi:hypothetical protein
MEQAIISGRNRTAQIGLSLFAGDQNSCLSKEFFREVGEQRLTLTHEVEVIERLPTKVNCGESSNLDHISSRLEPRKSLRVKTRFPEQRHDGFWRSHKRRPEPVM